MKKRIWISTLVLIILLSGAYTAHADLSDAVTTTGEGAVEFPLGLLKLVGGAVWTVGEVVLLPFRAFWVG